jgi:hypothetical protein
VEIGTSSASGGGISDNTANSGFRPFLVLGSDGNPIVAWCDDSDPDGDPDIYIRRWNGTGWVEIGTGSASGSGISGSIMPIASYTPALALGSDGNPIVAWEENVANSEIYVKRWDGSFWFEIGTGSASGRGISDNDGYSNAPSIILGSDGNPIVAWQDGTSGDTEIYVKKWE